MNWLDGFKLQAPTCLLWAVVLMSVQFSSLCRSVACVPHTQASLGPRQHLHLGPSAQRTDRTEQWHLRALLSPQPSRQKGSSHSLEHQVWKLLLLLLPQQLPRDSLGPRNRKYEDKGKTGFRHAEWTLGVASPAPRARTRGFWVLSVCPVSTIQLEATVSKDGDNRKEQR